MSGASSETSMRSSSTFAILRRSRPVTIRTTPTGERPGSIAAGPKRRISLPAYDRRGCFFAEVMGLELARAGLDYRGRYTLPWEYYVPRGRPAHVDKWLAESNQGLWARA